MRRGLPARVTVLLLALVATGSAAEPSSGESRFIEGSWFQFLGTADTGQRLWLYPHLDGVHEVFRETPGVARWHGDLESDFSSDTGEFANLFSAVEVLNEFLDPGAGTRERDQASRLLELFVTVHGGESVPYYLRPFRRRLTERLDDADLAWIDARVEAHRDALARVETPGTSIGLDALDDSTSSPEDPQDFYRCLLADGYLDVSIVGGNSKEKKDDTYHSWPSFDELQRELERMGFGRLSFRGAGDAVLNRHVTSFRGRPISVRVTLTAGSRRRHRIRRAVANFVEGLAHADVVVYLGHSNKLSGAYYLSETKSSFSRFRIGLGKSADLREKCHDLGRRPYQIVALTSCFSYDRYCRPIRWFLEREVEAPGRGVGFIGTPDRAYYADFAPRFAAFFELLLEYRGPRDIVESLNRIQPTPRTPPLIARGLLQPRFSFIVPAGVEIVDIEERGAGALNAVFGTGSDGRTYTSTELFPQNEPGEIVQVVTLSNAIYGLMRDGRVLVISATTSGAPAESVASTETGVRFEFIAAAMVPGAGERLLLVSRDGAVFFRSRRTDRIARVQPPQGARLVAIGNDRAGRLVARDDQGNAHAWSPGRRAFVPIAGDVQLVDATPSLLGHGVPGVVWTPGTAGRESNRTEPEP